MKLCPSRQVHLDFHTSEKIPGIGVDFQPEAFAEAVSAASINSMTVFARCHHGWLYYPSQAFPQLVHPQLARRNLLLEQVRALHSRGIKAPVYITVQWDYHTASTHPEWLIRKADGAHEGGPFHEPGFYQSLCVNTGYTQFLQAITKEVIELLGNELDGLFFDIVGTHPCWCAACRAEMAQRGIDPADDDAVRAFAKTVMDRFKLEMSAFVRQFRPDCTIFYNAGHVGPTTRASAAAYSHFELESIPSGTWGYLHFPVTARYARKLGKDCVGMTGKFHTAWGDFHSLKNLAALEFECFRMLSFGFAASIGDQLEPCGRLNPATYRLIGQVYRQFAQREAWARPSTPVVEAAVVTPERDDREFEIPESVMGAAQLLEELALQFDIIDPTMELGDYPLVILPDDLIISATFRDKLEAYVAQGGKVLACGRGGQDASGAYPPCFGVSADGPQENYPDFILAQGPLAAGLEPENEYVMYQQGQLLRSAGAAPLLYARAPYFPRRGDSFCSHLYTPSAHGTPYPVAFQNGNVLVLSHPLFSQYRENAPAWCKKLVDNAANLLLKRRLIRHNGPSTMTVSVLDQPELHRTNLHILTYIPVRKSATIDLVEERTVVRQITVQAQLPRDFTAARLIPDGTPLAVAGNTITIPEIDGYAVVELT